MLLRGPSKICLSVLCLFSATSNAISLSVASSGGNASSPLAYGVMFEDINHSGDGGIYAELIQNRAFQGSTEFHSQVAPWMGVGGATLTLQNTSVPLSKQLPTSVHVASSSTAGLIGLSNPGYWGISVLPQKYTGSFWVLGAYTGNFTVQLQGTATGIVYASTVIPSTSLANTWMQFNYTLTPTIAAPNTNNSLVVEFQAGTALNFNLLSLFPPTYKNRANGLRPDLMQALKGLNPSFLRMPGGNNLEGDTFHQQWKWNQTIGPLTQRPGRPGDWGYENTDGLGLIEYLLWCDDLNMAPILAVWDGLYQDFDNTGPGDVISQAGIGAYVQDTMNELEFIMGSSSTTYGALRTSLGYPKPWSIKYVEIGNEDQYNGGEATYNSYRFKAYYNAIIAKYPSMIILADTGDTGAQVNNSATDFHEYTNPDSFVSQFNAWDNVASSKNLRLVGEYAVVNSNTWQRLQQPIWIGSVAESIYALGVERNSYGMIGMSYAPTLENINSVQWTPDLIEFDADPSHTTLSTSYHAIALLSSARYTSTVPVQITSAGDKIGPAYFVAGTSGTGKYTLKMATYNSTAPLPFNVSFAGLAAGATGKLSVLTAPSPNSYNVFGGPNVVHKSEKTITAGTGGVFSFSLVDYSVAVLKT